MYIYGTVLYMYGGQATSGYRFLYLLKALRPTSRELTASGRSDAAAKFERCCSLSPLWF